jgi:type I restriction enzyme S subunit
MKALFGSQWKIPKEWGIVSLKDVTSDWRGGAPFEPEDFTAEGFPVLHKGSIHRRGRIVIDAKKKTFTTQEYAQSHQKSVIDNTYMAATLRDLVPSGPSIGLMADLSESPSDKYILAQGAYGFQLDASRLKPAYLVLLSNYEPFREYLKRYCVGSTQIHIRTPVFQELKIPLPPIAQQKRIAAILDKAEELRGLRRQALGALNAIAQSIFLEMFGDPATNPKGWDKGFLGDIAIFVGGGTPKRERPEYFEGSICWATSKDMKNEFLDDTQEYITPQAIEQSATNLVPIGTILIVVKSKILAHSLPVAITRVPTCFGQDIKGIKISERCTVAFVVTALRHSKRWLLERARGINTEGLTLDHLKAFPLMLPPISLQQEFARRVEAIEQLKTTHRESLTQLNALFASLQHRAFRGDL